MSITLAGPKRPPADPDAFAEAVAWHRDRLVLTDDQFQAMDEQSYDSAFTVAGVAQLDLVSDVWEAVDRAVANGEDLDTFKRNLEKKLVDAWGKDEPWRLDTIFRTNVQSAYSAGRYEQMTHPEVMKSRPFWRFSAIDDTRTSVVCDACDGVILPATDPWWQTHYAPLHHNCRSHVVTMSEREVGEGGQTPNPPDVEPEEGFGSPPSVGDWDPDISDVPAPLVAAYGE